MPIPMVATCIRFLRQGFFLLLVLPLLSVGHAASNLDRFDHEYIFLDADVSADANIEAVVRPYAEDLDRVMNRQVTISTAVMPVAQPESALGNLAADILRSEASRLSGKDIDIALMNHRGLRIPLPEGPVTVRTLFELMPFENNITLLKFTGAQIQQIADELAVYGGEPISGMRMKIDGQRGRDVTVDGNPLDFDATYWLATNVWMANGGGDMPTLWEPLERIDLPALIRESFIDYLSEIDQIEPYMDGRIQEYQP